LTTVTTAGTNGAPEDSADDDPFAYLYRPADGEAAPSQPRNTSYARPMEVGRAQYGQQPAAQAQPYRPYPQQQPPAAEVPTQQTRYAERSRPQPGEERPSGGRGKAAVIGAVAVVAAIAVGAGIALSGGDAGKQGASGSAHSSAPATPSGSASASASASPTASADPVSDASKLQAQGAAPGSGVKGAISADGGYLTLQAGSTVTWTVQVPTGGAYKFWLHFNNSGDDLKAAVAINGKDRDGGVTLKNYSKGNTDPAQAWYSTNIWPELQAGSNTVTVSLPAGSSGSVLLDQVALTSMSVEKYPEK